MSETVKKADFQDALDISSGTIVVNWDEWGYVTGLTIDWKSPEDIVNCIGWTLRRRKPETIEWSVDAAVLYDNVTALEDLKDWLKFNIQVSFVNPDQSNPSNKWQILMLEACTVQDHSINISDSSTFKMSGRAKGWTVTGGYTG